MSSRDRERDSHHRSYRHSSTSDRSHKSHRHSNEYPENSGRSKSHHRQEEYSRRSKTNRNDFIIPPSRIKEEPISDVEDTRSSRDPTSSSRSRNDERVRIKSEPRRSRSRYSCSHYLPVSFHTFASTTIPTFLLV